MRPVPGHRDRRCDRHRHVPPRPDSRTRTSSTSSPILLRIPVPEGVPMHELLDGQPFPGTGPYTSPRRGAENEIRLGRNPRFRVWDAAVRPDGSPTRSSSPSSEDEAQPVAMVENNDADYTSSIGDASPELLARIETQHPDRIHGGASATIVGRAEYLDPTIRQHRREEGGQLRDRSRPTWPNCGAGRGRHLPDPAAGLPGLPAVLPVYRPSSMPAADGPHPTCRRPSGTSTRRARADSTSPSGRRSAPWRPVHVRRARPRGARIPGHARQEEHARVPQGTAVVGREAYPGPCSTDGSRTISRRPTS